MNKQQQNFCDYLYSYLQGLNSNSRCPFYQTIHVEQYIGKKVIQVALSRYATSRTAYIGVEICYSRGKWNVMLDFSSQTRSAKDLTSFQKSLVLMEIIRKKVRTYISRNNQPLVTLK